MWGWRLHSSPSSLTHTLFFYRFEHWCSRHEITAATHSIAPNVAPDYGSLLTDWLSVKEPTTSAQLSLSFCQLYSPLFSLWLRASIILQHLILLLYIFHPLAANEKWKVPCSFSQPNLQRSFLRRETITMVQAKILSLPDKGSLATLIANDLRKPVLRFHFT